MAVRTRRFFLPTLVTTATDFALYTVPADRTALVKNFSFVNVANAVRTIALGVGDTTNAGVIVGPHSFAALASTEYIEGYVFHPGDVIVVKASVANSFVVSAFGALLLGAPS